MPSTLHLMKSLITSATPNWNYLAFFECHLLTGQHEFLNVVLRGKIYECYISALKKLQKKIFLWS
jgi:hypothetical protein